MHQLTAIDQTSLTHDAKGNITTNSNAQTYVWDFDNRMSSYNSGEYGYTYDAIGRRVSKTVIIGGGGQGARTPPKPGLGSKRAGARPRGGLGRKKAGSTSITTVFVLAGQQVLSEYKNTGSGTALVQQRKFVYASYIDEPVLMLDVDGETETKYFYHQNSLYSVAALTNQAGTVVERYSYLAYGFPTFHNPDGSLAASQTSSTINNPYLFTGRRLDPETGLFYYRARYYDVLLGRFIGRDPIGYRGGKNLYEYVGDNPASLTDPSGKKHTMHCSCTCYYPATEVRESGLPAPLTGDYSFWGCVSACQLLSNPTRNCDWEHLYIFDDGTSVGVPHPDSLDPTRFLHPPGVPVVNFPPPPPGGWNKCTIGAYYIACLFINRGSSASRINNCQQCCSKGLEEHLAICKKLRFGKAQACIIAARIVGLLCQETCGNLG